MKIINLYPEYKHVEDALYWWNSLNERTQARLRIKYNIKPRYIKGNNHRNILYTDIIEIWKKNEALPTSEKVGWAFYKNIDK